MYLGITPIFHFNKFAFRRSVKYPFHTVRTLPLKKPLGFHKYFTDRLNVRKVYSEVLIVIIKRAEFVKK